MENNLDKNDFNEEIKKIQMDLDEVKLENNKNFDVCIIEQNDISNLDWQDPNYLHNIVANDFCKIQNCNPEKFMEFIAEYLNVNDHQYSDIQVQTVYEDKNYLYEILYIKQEECDKNNFFGSLININGDKVFGNCLILKTYLSLDSYEMKYHSITKEDIVNFMHFRAHTKLVIYHEGNFEEVEVLGELQPFAESFFENDIYKVKKTELAFLKHNLNIWYFEDIYGEEDVLGNIIDCKEIDKCIIYTMNSDQYRGNFTLEEFEKIKLISKKLENFNVEEKYMKEEKDDLGRQILHSKYRVLEKVYKENI